MTTPVCVRAYQAARPPRPEPQGDITKAWRIAHDRGQVRRLRRLFAQIVGRRPRGQIADRRRVRGHRGWLADRWIGNSVLDSFLEDESLFGEFLRAPVSEGGVEPPVAGPTHVVVEVMPQLLDRGVVVPVHELLLQRPVRRFDHGVVVGVALV